MITYAYNLASASLVGILKDAGRICTDAVGLTLSCHARKVALKFANDDFSTYLQPLQVGVGVPREAKAIILFNQLYIAHHEHSANHMCNACGSREPALGGDMAKTKASTQA